MDPVAQWASVARDPDPAVAVTAWVDPAAPSKVLSRCPAGLLAYLTDEDSPGVRHLRTVLHNPAVPSQAKLSIAARLRGSRRRWLIQDLLEEARVHELLDYAPLLTAAHLERTVRNLSNGRAIHHADGRAEPPRERLMALLRGFTLSRDPKHRALAAQAFPLNDRGRHAWAEGTVSAFKLATDPRPQVRTGLARNPYLRWMSDTTTTRRIRRALLDDPEDRVRAAARRSGLHTTETNVRAALDLTYGATPEQAEATADTLFVTADPIDDPSPHVRATAVLTTTRADIDRWTRLTEDPSVLVRTAVIRNGYLAPMQIWQRLASDPDPRVRRGVASSRWAPSRVRAGLENDDDPAVARAAVEHG